MAELVLAALSGSPTGSTVLGFAKLLGSMFGADVSAVHVAEPHATNVVGDLAFGEDVSLEVVDGDPVREIVRAASRPRVGLVVAGSHPAENSRGFGWVTRELAIQLDRPLLVVPPMAVVPASLGRVLVPLEGTEATTAPIRALFERFPFDRNSDLVMLHTFTLDDMPPFANHEPHETDAWVHAFRDCYVPHSASGGDIVMRCGPLEQVVPEVAADIDAALTVVSWSQAFEPGHALLVKSLLADPSRPTLLVPTYHPTSFSAG